MTFSVSEIRTSYNSGRVADVLVTYGPVTFSVEESLGGLRALRDRIDVLLNAYDKAAKLWDSANTDTTPLSSTSGQSQGWA